MKYIKTDYSVPYYNMALEEYLMNSSSHNDDYVFFYIHHPSIIIGKHQNAYTEINSTYVRENNIYVARRISGGGAVYHDEGNLNYSFIVNSPSGRTVNFAPYIAPVIKTLNKLGVEAVLTGRNDLCIGERKFSGNAQYINGNKVLHHGTLMFDVNIESMLNALNVSEMKIKSKAVESVHSRVINLKEYLPDRMNIQLFKEALLETFFEGEKFEEYKLTPSDIAAVEGLVRDKFGLESYNLGMAHSCLVSKKNKFPAGIVEINFNVKNNSISEFHINGDFFTNKDVSKIENGVISTAFSENAVREKLILLNFDDYISNFTIEEMLKLIFA